MNPDSEHCRKSYLITEGQRLKNYSAEVIFILHFLSYTTEISATWTPPPPALTWPEGPLSAATGAGAAVFLRAADGILAMELRTWAECVCSSVMHLHTTPHDILQLAAQKPVLRIRDILIGSGSSDPYL
jgi:hypothetical protein